MTKNTTFNNKFGIDKNTINNNNCEHRLEDATCQPRVIPTLQMIGSLFVGIVCSIFVTIGLNVKCSVTNIPRMCEAFIFEVF